MGALGALGPPEEIDHPALGLEIIEQKPHPLEILECLEIVEQVSGAAHDELALVRFPAGPARESGWDDFLISWSKSGCGHAAAFLRSALASAKMRSGPWAVRQFAAAVMRTGG